MQEVFPFFNPLLKACGNVCHPAGTDNVAVAGCVPDPAGYYCKPTCNQGFGNCDGLDSTGCEIDLRSDMNHCGACARPCTTTGGASASCQNGACKITSCPAGKINCDGRADNGCETNANPCGCGCGEGSFCGDNGCEVCGHCGGFDECCTEGCQYCPDIGGVQCGPCIEFP